MIEPKNRLKRLINIYLGLFVLLSLFAVVYTVFTNYAAHEKILNKSLIATLSFAIVTAALFFLDAKKRANAALMHFSILFSLFLINLLFEIPLDQGNIERAAKRTGIKWDKRNKYEVVDALRKKDITAFPTAFFPAFVGEEGFFTEKFGLKLDNLFPLSGVANVETVLSNETGEWIIYKSDRYGFNNDDSVYEKSGRPILIVGDSFAQGISVPQKDSVAGNLLHRGYKAISLGTGGSGPLIELAAIKEYGPYLKPKIILWFYYEGNNYLHLPKEYRYPALNKYLEKGYSQHLINRQPEIDQFWADFFAKAEKYLKNEKESVVFWRKASSKKLLKGLILRMVTLHNIRKIAGVSRHSYLFEGVDRSGFDTTEPMFRNVMKIAKEEAEGLGAKLYFVYLPNYASFFNQKILLSPSSQTVRKIIAELDIPVIDFYKCLKDTGDPNEFFPFRLGGHYSVKGYNLLANLIEEEALK
ncbi:MAG: hypothetical protein Q7K98_03940 [Candidatus Omnitrophota bacterium]|nr:hypothetical protein [Candidatus Omnitrophota bacterium]